MSNVRFQPPAGLGWSVIRRPKFKTSVQNPFNMQGQMRTTSRIWPIWEYELTWNYVKGGAQSVILSTNAFEALMGFYLARQGPFDSFLFEDPANNTTGTQGDPTTGDSIGEGDGSATAFQVVKQIGSGIDVVQNINNDVPFTFQLFKYGWEGSKNLLRNSGGIGGGGWSFNYAPFSGGLPLRNAVVTLNAAFSPIGRLNATKVVFPDTPSAGDVNEIYQFLGSTPGQVSVGGRSFTFSVWLKSVGPTGNLGFVLGDNISESGSVNISITNQWQRYSFTYTFAGGNVNLSLVPVIQGSNGFPPQAFYCWGAQLEEGASATAYVPTGNSSAQWGPVYQFPSTRRNWALWSQAVDNAVWAKNTLTITADSVIAPDGTTTADVLTSTGTDGYTNQAIASPGTFGGLLMTFSVWLKVPTGTRNTFIFITYNNSIGTFFAPNTAVTLGKTWKRYTISTALPAGITSLGIQICGANSLGTGGIVHAWGAQLENWGTNGSITPYPWAGLGVGIDGGTSYIPTTSSGVTVTDYTQGANGLVTFGSAPASGATITWNGKYFLRVHFSDESIDMEEFMYQLHTLKKLKLESVII